MRFLQIAAALAVAVPTGAAAMTVEAFLAKADALQSKGFAAMFSGDVKVLTGVIQSDAAVLRAERQAATAAHQTPSYCPSGPIKLGSNEIFQAMRAVPAADRPHTDTRDVLRGYLGRRFPCPT
jgi:hypothetical protein